MGSRRWAVGSAVLAFTAGSTAIGVFHLFLKMYKIIRSRWWGGQPFPRWLSAGQLGHSPVASSWSHRWGGRGPHTAVLPELSTLHSLP